VVQGRNGGTGGLRASRLVGMLEEGGFLVDPRKG